LKADLKFSEVEASFVDVPDMQEDQILHDAANVLHGSLHAVEISKDFYPSSSNPKLNGVKLFLCNDTIISVTAIHFLALSCDNAL
jgi:sensor domain CHASE-containing protein